MICGHDRDELLRVLRFATSDDARRTTQGRCECGGPYCVIYNDLIDPAKLADIVAELLTECGSSVVPIDYDDGVELCEFARLKSLRVLKRLTMPETRAFTLRLLDDPSADVEQMIGEFR